MILTTLTRDFNVKIVYYGHVSQSAEQIPTIYLDWLLIGHQITPPAEIGKI